MPNSGLLTGWVNAYFDPVWCIYKITLQSRVDDLRREQTAVAQWTIM